MTTTKLTGDEVRLRLYEQFARIGKAVSHPRRLELVELLAQGERSVEILANAANLTVANTSQHLQQLRSAGLVTSRKEGLRVYYRLANDSVGEMLEVMQRLADTTLAEVDRIVSAYRSLQEQMEPIGAAELLARLKDGKVTLLDVRPHEEYEAGHVPGAINIPLAELESRIHELDPKCEVVAYCRGYFCLLADDAVTRLRRNGLNARRLSSGFPKWKRSGMPVDTSTRKH
ncbi:MAG: metalloregulator ArsR/SmtB family transcription factor [Zoogloeaceae bacterium]|nr:metalloregulator ArsR/SmtB family transcription factor [Gammaproteobacteria bacterium]MCP5230713.1 metalloregulator ArsR/SmtB family transcription factor [Zoogloeaceae bacterium]